MLRHVVISAKPSRVPAGAGLSELGREILGYLQEHRHAGDTLIGIVRWWLPRQRLEVLTASVQSALDELLKLGLVVRAVGTDGQASYRLKDKKRKWNKT